MKKEKTATEMANEKAIKEYRRTAYKLEDKLFGKSKKSKAAMALKLSTKLEEIRFIKLINDSPL